MKSKLSALLLVALCNTGIAGPSFKAECSAFFTGQNSPSYALVRELRKAESEILVQAYGFTAKDVIEALGNAAMRGVRVTVILDKSNKENPALQSLKFAGVSVLIDPRHAIAHNKVMIIDGHTVVTGSYNFTASAETRNAENLVVCKTPEGAGIYRNYFLEHHAHSKPY